MTQADRPDGKKNGWWVPARGLRPVHEAVIIALLGFLIGTLAAGAFYPVRAQRSLAVSRRRVATPSSLAPGLTQRQIFSAIIRTRRATQGDRLG
jgi:hypothetical protein